MDGLHMNRTLGTKWFTFYTKVRPWLACITTFNVVSDFLQYVEAYTSYWWMMLYLVAAIIQAVLGIMVFVKSQGNYIQFVHFVKKVLFFEAIYMVYARCVEKYIQNGFDFGSIFIMGIILLLISFLVWYCLNVEYFTKRIIEEKYVSNVYETIPTAQGNGIEDIETTYCRKCGNKLIYRAKFCNKCGTEIVEVGGESNEV